MSRLDELSLSLKHASGPADHWQPPLCGEMDLRISADGQWWYQGSVISRPELVRLFAGVLRREADQFFLVTPVEKWQIRVDDAPFIAIDADFIHLGQADQAIAVKTNVGDEFLVGSEHPLRIESADDEVRPYVLVREGLWALLSRACYYRLVAEVESMPNDPNVFGLRSQGVWTALL